MSGHVFWIGESEKERVCERERERAWGEGAASYTMRLSLDIAGTHQRNETKRNGFQMEERGRFVKVNVCSIDEEED